MSVTDSTQVVTDPQVVKPFVLSIVGDDDQPCEALSGTFLANCASHQLSARESGEATKAFAVAVKFLLSPLMPSAATAHRSVWYVTEYDVSIAPHHPEDDAIFSLIDVSPQNTNRSTTISMSTTTSWGVNLGMFGGTMTGGVDKSESSSASYSYQVSDMDVHNKSGGSVAQWWFKMDELTNVNKDTTEPKLSAPKTLQVSMFEPCCSAVWYAGAFKGQSLTFRVALKTTLSRSSFPEFSHSAGEQLLSIIYPPKNRVTMELDWARRPPIVEARSVEKVFFVTVSAR
ncbi:hypothetical protein [Burkholderia gladioli]|uniref:hypothetical protein n=1 Tax=Burkholderia gladioli TaxID=28095 RepID=UPI00163FB6BC|nr:hypothetical protein [Burkholderia gladioli]